MKAGRDEVIAVDACRSMHGVNASKTLSRASEANAKSVASTRHLAGASLLLCLSWAAGCVGLPNDSATEQELSEEEDGSLEDGEDKLALLVPRNVLWKAVADNGTQVQRGRCSHFTVEYDKQCVY